MRTHKLANSLPKRTENYDALYQIYLKFNQGDGTTDGFVNGKFTPLPSSPGESIYSVLLSDCSLVDAFVQDGVFVIASTQKPIPQGKVFAWSEL